MPNAASARACDAGVPDAAPVDRPGARTGSRVRSAQAATAVAVLGFAALFALYTRHNGFPYIYHADEPSKVVQLLRDRRNFHHPQLSLSATDALLRLGVYPRTPQQVAVAGRTVSATFAALAAVACGLTAYLLAGPWAGAVTTLLVGLDPLLFETAHYMKEDPALLLGVAATFLALAAYARRPTPLAAAGVGVGCALALSGKYVGAVMLIPSALVLARRPGLRLPRLAAFAAALAAVALLVNARVAAQLPDALHALRWELDRTVGSSAPGRSVPHAKAWRVVSLDTSPLGWVLLALGYLSLLAPAARRSPRTALALFAPLYLCMLSFTPKAADRYALPVLAVSRLLTVLGLAWLLARVPPGRWRGVEQGLAFVLLGWALARPDVRALRHLEREFRRDSRAELVAWIGAHLPADAVIAEERHARLGLWEQVEEGPPLRQIVISANHRLPELGSVEELREWGVYYLLLCYKDYGKLLRGEASPQTRELRAYYEQVMREGRLLWAGDEGRLSYLHPGLRLYSIEQSPARGSGPPATGEGR